MKKAVFGFIACFFAGAAFAGALDDLKLASGNSDFALPQLPAGVSANQPVEVRAPAAVDGDSVSVEIAVPVISAENIIAQFSKLLPVFSGGVKVCWTVREGENIPPHETFTSPDYPSMAELQPEFEAAVQKVKSEGGRIIKAFILKNPKEGTYFFELWYVK